jgi:hypothetical protein
MGRKTEVESNLVGATVRVVMSFSPADQGETAFARYVEEFKEPSNSYPGWRRIGETGKVRAVYLSRPDYHVMLVIEFQGGMVDEIYLTHTQLIRSARSGVVGKPISGSTTINAVRARSTGTAIAAIPTPSI